MKKILIVDDQQGWINYNKAQVNEIFGDDTIIHTASSALEGYNLLLENIMQPYDYIITDLQMEEDYSPKAAGEWLIEQIKGMTFYDNTSIIIVSAAAFISVIAERFGVNFIRKQDATTQKEIYRQYLY